MKKHLRYNKILKKIYEDFENPGCLSSIDKLYKEAQLVDEEIKRDDVIQYLRSNDSYTLHKPIRRKFTRRKCFFPYPGHTICIDICYVNKYKKSNTRYLIFFIDGMSKYLNVIPVNSIKSYVIVPILQRFFAENIYSYKYVYTDLGGEFCSKSAREVYSKFNIKWYSNHNKSTRNPIVERAILTIKRRLIRYISHSGFESFLPILNKLVFGYNISRHRGLLNEKPLNIHLCIDHEVIDNLLISLYKRVKGKKPSLPSKYEVGQVVRISSLENKFKRVTTNNYSRELFKIHSIDVSDSPLVYRLSELDSTVPILGIFYGEELSAVNDSGVYRLKVIRTRYKGKECLIQFVDFPNSIPKWIKKTELMKL